MSFYTSLVYYRPTKPLQVTGPSLAHFLRIFDDCNLLAEDSQCYVSIKFGSAIDQDDKPTCWQEPINDVISESREIDWDLQEQGKSIPELAALIDQHPRSIYRASLMLGCANKAIVTAFSREPSEDNEQPMCLWDFHISLEPVPIH